ncbi:putative hydrolase [Raoultella planticola]|uniref:Putative hydrolase n=1 Tax=Raoultella planticola TaxID=575 RepID=A0A485CLM6_RAOPL|nr:putative hydrolase [Raoultella planticola]
MSRWMPRLLSQPRSCSKACSYHMDKGFSRVYQRYLLNLLKANAARKLKAYPRLATG